MDKEKATTSSGVSEEAIQQPHFLRSDTSNDDALMELIDVLQQVDIESPLAKLNETTISDNNGGRIEL
ncbi:MAG TPA: hypothetical protein VIH90_01300 [Candidatus Saccharimonadales bacterium]